MMILSNNSTSSSGNYPSTLMNISGVPVQSQNSTHISPNPWVITTHEHRQNEGQFVVLRPIGGMIYGEQARPFFLKSGLSASALAQVFIRKLFFYPCCWLTLNYLIGLFLDLAVI